MNILVVGGGGREHAIIKKLAQSPMAERIYALPGNGGIAEIAQCYPIKATEIDKIVEFAVSHKVDFAVVAPDDPLVLGCVDKLNEAGIAAFGPTKAAAAIEGSKVFSKGLMEKYGIPTAKSRVFTSADDADEYLENAQYPTVIKADGLALGKGVIIAEDKETALSAINEIMRNGKFGASGKSVLIEEFLTGIEVSVLAFTDGKTIVPMVSSMDHKRALDGDKGLNTGGMGTIAPSPVYTPEIASRCMKEIFLPTVEAMNKEGRPFKGCLYFGLMLTEKGPYVIEYNCRFGDPETQVVLPLLESDLLDIMIKVSQGRLSEADVRFSSGAACCVVMASRGYPEAYKSGYEITVDGLCENEDVYIAGARLEEGRLLTSGGRVLGAVAVSHSLEAAVEKAYKVAEKIHFENAYFRRDIGKKALEYKKG